MGKDWVLEKKKMIMMITETIKTAIDVHNVMVDCDKLVAEARLEFGFSDKVIRETIGDLVAVGKIKKENNDLFI